MALPKNIKWQKTSYRTKKEAQEAARKKKRDGYLTRLEHYRPFAKPYPWTLLWYLPRSKSDREKVARGELR